MNILINTIKCFLAVCGPYFFISQNVCSHARGSVPNIDHAIILKSKGYSTDTTEQIIEATRSKSYFIRHVALTLLTERTGKQAIPKLKEALNDPRMEVRWRAAHLLGTLGDRGGLKRMQRDLKEYAPNNGAPEPTDPNIIDDHERKETERKRNLNLGYALDAALVLAEFGDRRGYELAVRIALAGPAIYHRSGAAHVLVEIAKTETNILSTEGIDPISILCKMAESEKNNIVFKTLIYSVYKLDDDKKVHILEKARNSPNQPETIRREAQLALDGIEARKKAAEIKRTGES